MRGCAQRVCPAEESLNLGFDEHAAVGDPSRDYPWIPSREPSMDPGVYTAILERLGAQGHEARRLVRAVHPPLRASVAPP